MSKMQKLYGYMLAIEEEFRIGTEVEIKEMVKKVGQPLWIKTLISSQELVGFMAEGIEVIEGYYITSDETCEVCGEEEDWEVVKLSNLVLV